MHGGKLLATLGAFSADALQLPVDSYDPNDNFEAVVYDGMTETIRTYVPVVVQKLGDQVPNIPSDIKRFSGQALAVTGVGDASKKIGSQLPNIPKDVARTVKVGIDKATGESDADSPITVPNPTLDELDYLEPEEIGTDE